MSFIKSVPQETEGPTSVMNRFPAHAAPLAELTEQIMRVGECNFPMKDRELIAAFTSGQNNCTFCYNTHRETAAAFGLDEVELEAMINDVDTSDVDERLKPVLRYVQKLTKTPFKIVQADVDSIFDAGWGETDFHYVVMICALFNFYNRLMDGYGIVGTPERYAAAGPELASMGYLTAPSLTKK